jgi:capsular exopolysaccharide synthesis family protein
MREVLVNRYPKSSVTEAIKIVRTNLKFSSVNSKIQTILITSSVANEGKSFVSANLAASFANNTENVLLVDCDLRRGRILELFTGSREPTLGLSNLLIDNNWKKNLQNYIRKTDVYNLDILTTGSIPPNPGILLESKKIEEVIKYLRGKYNIIIFDTPPVIGLNDALSVSRLADTALIVARSKKTSIVTLEATKEALENVNVPIAGIILNRVDTKNKNYYKNYYETY